MICVLGMMMQWGLAANFPKPNEVSVVARNYVREKDWLGFRVFIKKSLKEKLLKRQSMRLRKLIYDHAGHGGYDLIYLWNQRPTPRDANEDQINAADIKMLKNDFEGAFAIYQAVAKSIRPKVGLPKEDEIAETMYPYVLHSMGRALFGMRKYKEALTVYNWIPQKYPRIKQVLFEKMWSAFKAGRVDHALGAIASQRSVFFNGFLPAESYIILAYVYRKLCREEDLRLITKDIDAYEKALKRGKMNVWAQSELETRALLELASTTDIEPTRYVSTKEKTDEQRQIKSVLQEAFDKNRNSLLNELKIIRSHVLLTQVADTGSTLSPVEKIKGRAQLLKQNLEIWPADTQEEWADEVGHHLFLGESQCQLASAP